MRLPYRSISSIQPLPSIYTTFPANYGGSDSTNTSGIHSGTCLIRKIEDGIEAVPFERSNILSAPILSPDQEEKEVFVPSWEEVDNLNKPLPSLPRCIWQRMSQRQRILSLLSLQFLMLLTIGLSLLAVKDRSSTGDEDATAYVASNDPSSTNITNNLRRGIFALPVELPQQQSMACLASKDQINAWQCASETTFQLSILPASAGNDSTIMIAVGSSGSNDTVRPGERIPNIPPLELLAINNAEHENDFAYHFRTTYDKIVLLSEDELPLAGEPHVHASTSNTLFQPGDSLWQCIFNETTVEGYIYPNRATTASATNTASGTVDVDNSITLPDFPYAVELVEEWTPNGKTPHCSKMTMQSDGTLAPLSEEVMLRLDNSKGNVPVSTSQRMGRIRHREQREEAHLSQCQCQWVIS